MKNLRHDIRVFHRGDDLIGECPIWNVDDDSLCWVDTRRPSINRLDVNGCYQSWQMPSPLGAFAFRRTGGILAAMQAGFAFVDLARDSVAFVRDPEPDLPQNKLNDGKCDSAGRFWCGSSDTNAKNPAGSLYRLDADLTCHRMDTGFIISNAIAFSPKQPVMIFGDSTGDTIYRYDFDLASGAISNRRVFLNTQHVPWRIDGANFDTDGYYWCAMVHDWSIGRFDLDGRLDRVIRLPARYPTMCCFGGPDLDILYVTTASVFLSDEEREQQPLAGSVFSIHGLGARGMPAERFGG